VGVRAVDLMAHLRVIDMGRHLRSAHRLANWHQSGTNGAHGIGVGEAAAKAAISGATEVQYYADTIYAGAALRYVAFSYRHVRGSHA